MEGKAEGKGFLTFIPDGEVPDHGSSQEMEVEMEMTIIGEEATKG